MRKGPELMDCARPQTGSGTLVWYTTHPAFAEGSASTLYVEIQQLGPSSDRSAREPPPPVRRKGFATKGYMPESLLSLLGPEAAWQRN